MVTVVDNFKMALAWSQIESRVFALLMFLFSLGLFYTGHWVIRSVDTTVEATVVDIRDRGRLGGIKIVYDYAFDGRNYTTSGDVKKPAHFSKDIYEKGKTIEVYMSPKYPAVSYPLKPKPMKWYVLSFIFLMISVFIYIMNMGEDLRYARQKRKL